jgi:hypothetical protein
LPNVPIKQLRLQVDPRGGGLGAKAPVIRLALRASDLVFLARGEAPYQLAVGRDEAQAADLPLSALIPVDIEQAIASGRLGRARVAGSAENAPSPLARIQPQPVPAAPPASAEDGGSARAVLWLVLLVGVALLAGMAFSLLRSAKKEKNSGS